MANTALASVHQACSAHRFGCRKQRYTSQGLDEAKREMLTILWHSQEKIDAVSATSGVRHANMGIGACLVIIRNLPGIIEGDDTWLAAAMLLSRDKGLQECLVYGCTTDTERLHWLSAEIKRARKHGFFKAML